MISTKKSVRRGLEEILAATTDIRYIYRTDYGWEFRPGKNKRVKTKQFTKGTYGDIENALRAAIIYRDEYLRLEGEDTVIASSEALEIENELLALPDMAPVEVEKEQPLLVAGEAFILEEKAEPRLNLNGHTEPLTKTQQRRATVGRKQRLNGKIIHDPQDEYDGDPDSLKEKEKVIYEPLTPIDQTVKSFFEKLVAPLVPAAPQGPTIIGRPLLVIDGYFMSNRVSFGKIDYVLLRRFLEKSCEENQKLAIYYFDAKVSESSQANSFHRFLMGAPPHGPKFQVKTYERGYDIALSVFLMAEACAGRFDHLVLAAGDRSYAPLVEAIGRMGKLVTLIGTPDTVAPELQMIADESFWFDEYMDIYRKM